MDCGEPMVSQHLRIDFNPLRDVDDNEFLLNKCMSFWKLIEGSKELQELKVLPEVCLNCKITIHYNGRFSVRLEA